MNVFYVLRSEKDKKLYKGSTKCLEKRIEDHDSGRVRSTKPRRPLRLIYQESYKTYKEALEKEKYYKTLKGGKELKKKLDIGE